MIESSLEPLCEPVLKSLGVAHGFGCRGSKVPESTAFLRQAHGVEVIEARPWSSANPPQGDALISSATAPCVGIVTADCVPILLASADGRQVAAIHAGWRGLAAGVIEAGLAAFRSRIGKADWSAAVGPAARGCCYEIDEPVQRALTERYRAALDESLLSSSSRPGHYQLDLPLLASRILEQNGTSLTQIGVTHRVCTICDAARFESFRRDGEAAGRLRHFIVASDSNSGEG